MDKTNEPPPPPTPITASTIVDTKSTTVLSSPQAPSSADKSFTTFASPATSSPNSPASTTTTSIIAPFPTVIKHGLPSNLDRRAEDVARLSPFIFNAILMALILLIFAIYCFLLGGVHHARWQGPGALTMDPRSRYRAVALGLGLMAGMSFVASYTVWTAVDSFNEEMEQMETGWTLYPNRATITYSYPHPTTRTITTLVQPKMVSSMTQSTVRYPFAALHTTVHDQQNQLSVQPTGTSGLGSPDVVYLPESITSQATITSSTKFEPVVVFQYTSPDPSGTVRFGKIEHALVDRFSDAILQTAQYPIGSTHALRIHPEHPERIWWPGQKAPRANYKTVSQWATAGAWMAFAALFVVIVSYVSRSLFVL